MSYQRPLNSAPDHSRLNDLLEAIKKEFDSLTHETSAYKVHQDEFEIKFSQQNQELANIRNTVYELEQTHRRMKEAYEDELLRLKQELESRDRLLQQQSIQQAPLAVADRPEPGAPANGLKFYPAQSQLPPLQAQGQQQQAQQAQQQTQLPPQQPQQPQSQPRAPQQLQGTHLPPPANSPTNGSARPFNGTPKSEAATGVTSPAPATVTPTAAAATPAVKPEEETALVKRAQHNKPIPAFLKDLDSYAVLPYKKQFAEFYLLFNPNVPKKADIKLLHSFDHASVVCCVRFSKDGKFLATGCNKLTQVFSVDTGELIARLSDDSVNPNGSYDTDSGDLYIRSVCFSPDGKYLATGAEDKLIRIWDLTTRSIIKVLRGHEQDIYSLDFFPDGSKLVSGSGDRTVRIWDLLSSQCSLTLSIEDGVTTVAVSPDGKLIAAGSLDRTVRVWDANQGFLVERLDAENEVGHGHRDSVYSVAFTHDGKEIASGSLDRTVKLWSLDVKYNEHNTMAKPVSNCEVTYVGHKDFVLSVCCTPDDKFILSGSKDRGVILWDKESGEPYIMLQGHRNSVISVSVSPVMSQRRGLAGGCFATGSGDCKAKIWRWEHAS
ncbi:unnamed protein product [Kuraishia capsulata CBS 1993]|uniref:Transcriptional repressor Tup1 N-terminal domain-containing protein n=1 Tax=Kuraishia capsulata CBS 1993 TaxID=1382522 RepID=W6MUA3_9ASCO|nr:uncharacterized protein KUCA_T00005028001 [Kuraishia capsulata CBS 1993]CDK29042.1 unnamed protein product [Kuraishia capsulata CBS 1993]